MHTGQAEQGGHVHADSVTVRAAGPVDAAALVDLLEDPPPSAYRIKGVVAVDAGRGARPYVVNVVSRQVHIATGPEGVEPGLVAIGTSLDKAAVRARLEGALRPARGRSTRDGVRRLVQHKRLSV